MNDSFMDTEIVELSKPLEKGETQYEYAGYQIKVYFMGDKTLTQCMQNLIARANEG